MNWNDWIKHSGNSLGSRYVRYWFHLYMFVRKRCALHCIMHIKFEINRLILNIFIFLILFSCCFNWVAYEHISGNSSSSPAVCFCSSPVPHCSNLSFVSQLVSLVLRIIKDRLAHMLTAAKLGPLTCAQISIAPVGCKCCLLFSHFTESSTWTVPRCCLSGTKRKNDGHNRASGTQKWAQSYF